jgi:hypothetical protein
MPAEGHTGSSGGRPRLRPEQQRVVSAVATAAVTALAAVLTSLAGEQLGSLISPELARSTPAILAGVGLAIAGSGLALGYEIVRRRASVRRERAEAREYLDSVFATPSGSGFTAAGDDWPDSDFRVPATPSGYQPAPQFQSPVSPLYEAVNAARYDELSGEAETEVRKHLPLNPRSAKRVLNHLRLAFFIAEKRGVFAGDEITRAHVAKWVLLTEQWPRLGEVLVADRRALDKLEGAEDLTRLGQLLDKVCPSVEATPELLELLREQVPLTGVLDRIVRFGRGGRLSAAVEAPEGGPGPE